MCLDETSTVTAIISNEVKFVLSCIVCGDSVYEANSYEELQIKTRDSSYLLCDGCKKAILTLKQNLRED